jgi:hypothetical protein
MPRDASELARRLAREAEAVCRHYLSHGKRAGRYWVVGDVHNTPGRSLFVRLQESAKGPAGKWTDAATGEHGDLLDVIRESLGLRDFTEVAREARRFLSLSGPHQQPAAKLIRSPAPAGSQDAARRLFAASSAIECQSACKFAPSSASNFDPFGRRDLAVALVSSELVGIAEARRARVM